MKKLLLLSVVLAAFVFSLPVNAQVPTGCSGGSCLKTTQPSIPGSGQGPDYGDGPRPNYNTNCKQGVNAPKDYDPTGTDRNKYACCRCRFDRNWTANPPSCPSSGSYGFERTYCKYFPTGVNSPDWSKICKAAYDNALANCNNNAPNRKDNEEYARAIFNDPNTAELAKINRLRSEDPDLADQVLQQYLQNFDRPNYDADYKINNRIK
jgi:hypothetical protein